MTPSKLISFFVILPFALFSLAGCGDSGGPDPKVEQVRVDEAKKIRGIFEAAGGDYAKVNATDKAAFEKYAGGATQAEQLWNGMKGGSLDTGSGPNP